MKKITNYFKSVLLLSLSVLLGFSSCDSNKDDFLDDYSTILYILNSGIQDITLYKTGENTTLGLTVDKAGSDLSTSATAKLALMTDAELKEYNTDNFTYYKFLPASCYELPATSTLDFKSKEEYKIWDVVFNTDAIYELGDLTDYVLPFTLASSDSVNALKNFVIYRPSVVIPTVYFGQTGYTRNLIEGEKDTTMTFKLPVALPIQNKWNFTCNVEVDQTLLDAYNAENGLSYMLLPKDAYTLAGDGVVTFTNMDDVKNLEITVTNKNLKFGNYVLPLRLTSCSMEAFQIDPENSTCLYGISYVPTSDKLKLIPLTASMLSTNAQEPSEGSLANLLDNNTATYFHSAWSVSVPEAHYLQVDLGKQYTAFSFDYIGRASGSSGNPAEIVLKGSLDGVNYLNIDLIKDGLPLTGAASKYNSPVFVAQPFRYLRLVVNKNAVGTSYFVFSEFSMKGLQ